MKKKFGKQVKENERLDDIHIVARAGVYIVEITMAEHFIKPLISEMKKFEYSVKIMSLETPYDLSIHKGRELFVEIPTWKENEFFRFIRNFCEKQNIKYPY